MHEMAPAGSTEPHEGHTWPDADDAGPDGTGGKLMDGLVRPALDCPTAAGSGTVPGTMNGFWHTGQRTVLPEALSGTCIDR
jgi:hypothetical protein